MRPEAIGREGLFMASSSAELGNRWFDIVPTRRFNHIHMSTFGKRISISEIFGVVFVVMKGPERAAQRAKIVCGQTTFLKSSAVNIHRVCR
jgi:hypothetical protein